ncbi:MULTISPECIES: hypothetical protein [Thermocrispum]|jgi:hypothetical protein|uniref:Uncharacterized protein n=1 Tax=Thermocrispum agreste TaxID=37925 RepID=A0ABD6FE72_9PSEU|nr:MULTISPECIES: hypothetical protein [Thermocrispum]
MTTSPGQPDPVSARLTALIDLGFQFLHPTDAQGQVQAVVGIRVHDGVVDVVQLHAEDDVTATRMPVDEPDIMAPSTVLWREHGNVTTVLDAVLALPDESEHAGTGTGVWVPAGAGQFRFLRS